jgi:hypothetical protein
MLSASFVGLCPALKKYLLLKKQDILKKNKGPTIPLRGRLQILPTPTGPNTPPLSPKPPFLS